MTTALQCPTCYYQVSQGDDFCESCGSRLTPPPPSEDTCPKCGRPVDDGETDGYCSHCGYRLSRPNDHVEVELAPLAMVTDKGIRHHRNEDSGALRVGEGFRVLVVCDGVSTTSNPDQASAAAAEALAGSLEAALLEKSPGPEEAVELLRAGCAAAQAAVLEVPLVEPGGYPDAPSSTLAAAFLVGDMMAVASIGDSRVYWIDATPSGASCILSRDDSLAEAAISAGESADTAYARRDAHTITRWLGADAPETDPNVQVLTVPGPGFLLVCSDGLWNYFESPETMRKLLLVDEALVAQETTLQTASRLVDAANAAGGHDNITVALLELPEQPEAAGATIEPLPAKTPPAEVPPVEVPPVEVPPVEVPPVEQKEQRP